MASRRDAGDAVSSLRSGGEASGPPACRRTHSYLRDTTLGPQLVGGQCRPYNSALRVRTLTGLTTYPDVTVICDKFEHYKTFRSLRDDSSRQPS